MQLRTILSALVVIMCSLPSLTFAYSVCGTLNYFDSRADRDNGFGSKLTSSTQFTNRPVAGVDVTVREENGTCRDGHGSCAETSGDAVWGQAITDSNGDFCVTVPYTWADVYYTAEYVNYVGRVLDDSGDLPRVYSPTTMNIGGSITKDWNLTCPVEWDGLCPTANPWAISIVYPLEEAYANILATFADIDAQTSLATLTSNGHNNKFTAHYPQDAGPECGASMRSWGYDDFCVTEPAKFANHLFAHEIAHNIMRRHINYSGNVSGCGSSGSWTGPLGGERCVTSEGWADFFSGAMHWSPDATAPWYRFNSWKLEGETTQGNGGINQDCVSNGSSPEQAIGNAARFFWDIFDSTVTNEWSYEDNSRVYLSHLVEVWDEFPSSVSEGCVWSTCYLNRESVEGGTGSMLDGRNAHDYKYQYDQYMASFGWTDSAYEELVNNCLSAQDPL